MALIKAENVRFQLTSDLKVVNLCSGLQNHVSSFPCPWCLAHKSELGEEAKSARTFGHIKRTNQDWIANGGKHIELKNFFNCVHEPLLHEDDDTKVIEAVPLPQLHLLLGVVNMLYKKLSSVWENGADKWTTELNVTQNAMHGGEFNGNACRKLLKNADCLEHLATEANHFGAMPIIKCFKAFDKVVATCFGVKLDADHYKIAISQFKKAFLDLDLSVTPKVHAIFFHIEPFLQGKDHGLGLYSEQAMESAHSKFKAHWSRYNVSKSSSRYPQSLLSCLTDFNSKHL